MISAAQWRRQLAGGVSESEFDRLRSCTHTGRPLGNDSIVSKLDKLLGRRGRPLPVGRPGKTEGIKKQKKTVL